MHTHRTAPILLAAAILAPLLGAHALQAQTPSQSRPASQPQPSTVVPVPRNDDWWQQRHQATLDRIKQAQAGTQGAKPVDLLFIGDSITQGWEGAGKDIWTKRYAPRNAVNLGFSGDRTQHVLWRLQHGEIDNIAPKLAVVMIGTNNSNGRDNTPEEIAAGIEAIVKTLRDKLPQTKILLLAIFPRAEKPDPQRGKNAKASEIASHLADGKMVQYLDIGPKFLGADGTMSKDVMPDFLHPNARGYEIWADAIEGKIKELMGESAATRP